MVYALYSSLKEPETQFLLKIDTLNEWYSKNLFECYVRTIYNLDVSYIDYSDSLKPFESTLRAYAQN